MVTSTSKGQRDLDVLMHSLWYMLLTSVTSATLTVLYCTTRELQHGLVFVCISSLCEVNQIKPLPDGLSMQS